MTPELEHRLNRLERKLDALSPDKPGVRAPPAWVSSAVLVAGLTAGFGLIADLVTSRQAEHAMALERLKYEAETALEKERSTRELQERYVERIVNNDLDAASRIQMLEFLSKAFTGDPLQVWADTLLAKATAEDDNIKELQRLRELVADKERQRALVSSVAPTPQGAELTTRLDSQLDEARIKLESVKRTVETYPDPAAQLLVRTTNTCAEIRRCVKEDSQAHSADMALAWVDGAVAVTGAPSAGIRRCLTTSGTLADTMRTSTSPHQVLVRNGVVLGCDDPSGGPSAQQTHQP